MKRERKRKELPKEKEVIQHPAYFLYLFSSFININFTLQKHNVGGGTGHSLPRRVRWLQQLWLMWTQPLNKLPSYIIAVALNRERLFKMKSGSFPEQKLLKRPPWSVLLLEAMLVCDHCFSEGHIAVHGLYCHWRPTGGL